MYSIGKDIGISPTTIGHWCKRTDKRITRYSRKVRSRVIHEFVRGDANMAELSQKYNVKYQTVVSWVDPYQDVVRERKKEERDKLDAQITELRMRGFSVRDIMRVTQASESTVKSACIDAGIRSQNFYYKFDAELAKFLLDKRYSLRSVGRCIGADGRTVKGWAREGIDPEYASRKLPRRYAYRDTITERYRHVGEWLANENITLPRSLLQLLSPSHRALVSNHRPF